jgi:hypothetical protein
MTSLRSGIGHRMQRVNLVLARHSILALLGSALLMILLVRSAIFIGEPERGLGIWGWLCLISIPYSLVAVASVPRLLKQPAAESLSIRWAFAFTPFLLAFAARVDGGPWWLVWTAMGVTLGLIGLTLASTRLRGSDHNVKPKGDVNESHNQERHTPETSGVDEPP